MNKTVSLLAAFAFTAAIFVSIIVGQITGNSDHYIVTLSMLPILTVLLTIFALGDEDTFSPLYLILYLLILSVFAKTIFLIYLDSGRSKLISLDGRDLEILVRGLVGLMAGILSLVCGYCVIIRRSVLSRKSFKTVRTQSVRFSNSRPVYNSQAFVVFLFMVSCIFFICFIWFSVEFNLISDFMRGVYSAKRIHEDTVGESYRGSSLGYLRWGAVTLPQVVLLGALALRWVYGKKFAKSVFLLLVFLGVGSLLIPILTSGRLEMIYLFLMIGMLTHYYKKKFSASKVLLLALLLVSITGILGEARTSQKLGVGVDTWSVSNVIDKVLGSAYFVDIAKTSVVLDTVPESVDYLYGKSLTLFLIAPIPRSIWPEKPVVRISTFVGEQIYNRPDRSGIPPGFIAEAYLNFGFPGIISLLFALGILCGKLYKSTVVHPKSAFSLLWYTVGAVILTFTLLSGDLTVAVSQAVRYGLVLLVFNRLFVRSSTYLKR